MRILCILLASLVLSVAQQPPANARRFDNNRLLAPHIQRPPVTLQQALRIAEDYVKTAHIDVEPYYLREGKLSYSESSKERFWSFVWDNLQGAMGDQVVITVDMEGHARRTLTM